MNVRATAARRLSAGLAATVLGVALATGPALGQVPLPTELPLLPTEEPTDEPTEEPSGDPTEEPTEEPSTAPSDAPTGDRPGTEGDAATPTPPGSEPPAPQFAEAEPHEPSDAPSGGDATLPGFEVGPHERAAPVDERPPEVAPGRTGAAPAVDTGGTTTAGALVAAGVDPVAAALPGTFGIALLAALLGVATLTGTLSLTRRGLVLATTADGGTDVETTRRWRVMAGVALLAAAGLVGILGYLKISIETLVPVQVVYLASAGFGVIVLAAAGGALLISEQLRTDERRLIEIESALATIAEHLRPDVADAPRLLDRE